MLPSVLYLCQFGSVDFLTPETFRQPGFSILQLLADLLQSHIPLLLLLLKIMHPLDTGLNAAQLLHQSGICRMATQPVFHGGLLPEESVESLPPTVATGLQRGKGLLLLAHFQQNAAYFLFRAFQLDVEGPNLMQQRCLASLLRFGLFKLTGVLLLFVPGFLQFFLQTGQLRSVVLPLLCQQILLVAQLQQGRIAAFQLGSALRLLQA